MYLALLLIFAIIAIPLLLYFIFTKRMCTKDDDFDSIPGPPGIFLLENALEFNLNPVALFYHVRSLVNRYGDLIKIKLATKKFLLMSNPEDIEILISGSQNNTKGCFYKFLKNWLQDGLILTESKQWHDRRKILTPAFHFEILKNIIDIIDRNSQQLVKSLQTEVGKRETDIASYIAPFTLYNICETAMGTKLDEESDGKYFEECINNIGEILFHRGVKFWLYLDIVFNNSSAGKKFKEMVEYLTVFRNRIINKRIVSNDHIKLEENVSGNGERRKLAMLDLLLHAESKGLIDRKTVGQEVDTFTFAGHDTTLSALQFIFLVLANNASYQGRIVKELQSIFGECNRPVTINDLTQMKFMEMCIKESMRLYPPVHLITRRLNQTTKFRKYTVPEGTDCNILIYDLHRSRCFKDPLSFRPERFIDEASNWHPFSYIPFSAGPRNCIGQKFAIMEMKLAISAVLRRYKLLPVTRPKDVVITTNIVLRPKYPILVKIVDRE